ncbi:sensor histidine kinase [Chitinophaga ginsengisoli]|uniref:Histidine kinase n=1 Tax=Chitinophaga ginsengisoli TaxID=363837 RepID=A0A2P8G4U6_9BACT|nr:histidine kinase [Chitinophaga ginsengisoli]PSL29003.1 histidine kinase [Chitinophaga ginsengisoli]
MAVRHRKFKIVGYFLMGVLFYFLLHLINPWDYDEWSREILIDTLMEIAVTITGVVLVVELGFWITKRLDNWLPWRKSIKKRIVVQLGVQIILVSLIIACIKMVFPTLLTEEIDFRQAMVMGIILSILITAIVTAELFFTQWNQSVLEATKYEQQATKAQLEFLKMQVDPHFLFNNFSTLTSLIEEDPRLAVEYLQRLSAIYRHVLKEQEQQVVRLEEELEFINAYLFLYKTRYQDSLLVEVDIPGSLMDKGIATATLQLLVENAIKHNSISKQNPLTINIHAEGAYLVVKNNINQTVKRVESTGLGLKNIAERYLLLCNQEIVIEQTPSSFVVKIPLLENKV